MSEEDQPSARYQKLALLSIPLMLVLLILIPFEIEIRLNLGSLPEVRLSSINIFAWSWAYELVGNQTGFREWPFYHIAQNGMFSTISQLIFLGAYIGFSLGLTPRKTAVRIGIFSLVPALFVAGVNLLAIFVPGQPSVIVQIPLQVISMLGLIILRLTSPKPSQETWLAK